MLLFLSSHHLLLLVALSSAGEIYWNVILDGKEYDPTDFDYAAVDAAERVRDTLPAPNVRVLKPKPYNSNKEFIGKSRKKCFVTVLIFFWKVIFCEL